MAPDTLHSMDGTIQPGDVVVSHVNGTRTLYIIATVGSTVGDLTLHSISTMTGEDASIIRGYEQQKENQAVWLFGGSAAAYVKAPPVEQLTSRTGPASVTPESNRAHGIPKRSRGIASVIAPERTGDLEPAS